jgi:hypothetical protein
MTHSRRRKLITDTVRAPCAPVVEVAIAQPQARIHPSNEIGPIGSTWRGNLMIWLLPTSSEGARSFRPNRV